MVTKKKPASRIVPKAQIARWDKAMKKHQAAVAKARDDIDAFLDEMTMLKECCERAHEDIQRAREALSELV